MVSVVQGEIPFYGLIVTFCLTLRISSINFHRFNFYSLACLILVFIYKNYELPIKPIIFEVLLMSLVPLCYYKTNFVRTKLGVQMLSYILSITGILLVLISADKDMATTLTSVNVCYVLLVDYLEEEAEISLIEVFFVSTLVLNFIVLSNEIVRSRSVKLFWLLNLFIVEGCRYLYHSLSEEDEKFDV